LKYSFSGNHHAKTQSTQSISPSLRSLRLRVRSFQKKFKWMILSGVLFVLSALSALALSCTRPEPSPEGKGDLPAYDRARFAITVPANVHRIVSMVPSITLTLIDLDLGDRIVAVDTQSAIYLKPARDVPVFDMLRPDAESLLILKPDIILASDISMMGNKANDPFEPLKRLGICVAYIPTSLTISGIIGDLRFIAAVTGCIEEGERLVAEMERELSEIAALNKDRGPGRSAEPEGQRFPSGKQVYFEVSGSPFMYSFGRGVYLNEMIEAAGGQNIFASIEGWIPVEAESVVSANPDIIFTNAGYPEDPVGEILSRPGWNDMKAIKNRAVYQIDAAFTSLPNHYITKGIRAMMEYLH